MKKVLEFVHDLWIRFQVKAPPAVQRTVIDHLHGVKDAARLLASPHLPVYRLEGQAQGGPLEVTYAGLEFAKPIIKNMLFVDEPVEQRDGQIHFWQRDGLANLSPGDIVAIEAPKYMIHKLPRQNAIVWPRFVHHILDVRGDWSDVKRRFHTSARRELRLTRRHGYQYEVSHREQDFEMFYQDMYLPTMKIRHGDKAPIMSTREARWYFRHGFLFLVKRDGQCVCGSLCHIVQDEIRFVLMGLINGDQQLMKEGAVGALNCLRIEWANQQGYRAVNFLSSTAQLGAGLFQYKRKWGAAVSIPQHAHRRVWIKVRRCTPAVARFLKESPLIVVDRDEKLHGLIVVDDPGSVPAETIEEWEKRYATPGLSSLVVCSVRDFTEGAADIHDPDLVIPISSHVGCGDGD